MGDSAVDFDSPRFGKACARTGILREQLREVSPPDVDAGADAADAAILQVRFEHAKRKRDERMRLVLECHAGFARQEQAQAGARSKQSVGAPAAAAAASVASPMSPGPDDAVKESELLARERAQLERIKLRQKQDIEQLMHHEVRLARQRDENERRMEADRAAKEERGRLKQERQQQEEQRQVAMQQEAQRRVQEEEKQRRRLAERDAKLAKEQARREAAQAAAARRAARLKQEEREAKTRRCQEETRRLFDRQQQRVMNKQKELKRRDMERQAALAEKKDRMAAEHAEKTRVQRKRVSAALSNQQRQLEATREQYRAKQRKAADQQRQRAAVRKFEGAAREERLRLKEQDRLGLIERKKRVDQYNRTRFEEKIRRENARAQDIAAQRAVILREREQARLQVMKEKNAIFEAFEQMKISGKLKLPPGVTLDIDVNANASGKPALPAVRSVTGGATGSGKGPRPRSAGVKRPQSALPRSSASSGATAAEPVGAAEASPMEAKDEPYALDGFDDDHEGGDAAVPVQSEDLKDEDKEKGKDKDKDKNKVKNEDEDEDEDEDMDKDENLAAAETEAKAIALEEEDVKPRPQRPMTANPAKRDDNGGKVGSNRPQTASMGRAKRKRPKRKSSLDKVVALETDIRRMKRKQNEHLLGVLEDEQAQEKRREKVLLKTKDRSERQRLDRKYGQERSRASERIVRITQDHEEAMGVKIAALNRLIAKQPAPAPSP